MDRPDVQDTPLTTTGRFSAQLGAVVYAVAWGIGGAIITAGTLYVTESRRRLRGRREASPRERMMNRINNLSVYRTIMESLQSMAVSKEYDLRREYSERFGIGLDDLRGATGFGVEFEEDDRNLRQLIQAFGDSVFANDKLFATLQEAIGTERYTAWMAQLTLAQRKDTDQEAAVFIIGLIKGAKELSDDQSAMAIGALSNNQRVLMHRIVAISQRLASPPKDKQH